MPTGYTAAVCDGKITEFPAFALQCARAFGALITMRDDAMNAPIPEEIKPDTSYYDKNISEAEHFNNDIKDSYRDTYRAMLLAAEEKNDARK